MISLLFAVLVPVADEVPVPMASPPVARCKNAKIQHVEIGAPVERKNLGELPPADTHLTVERRVEGCTLPVLVRGGARK